MKHQSGFTLIELLVTISIIGLVFGVVASAANSSKPTARDAERQADLKTIQGILQRYYSDQVYYPTTLPSAGSPLTQGSVTYSTSLPGDPTGGSYDYSCTQTSGGVCMKYCLGAKLEQVTTGSSTCGLPATDTLQVGPPQ